MKRYKKYTRDELFMLFLNFGEFKQSLFVKSKDGSESMPNKIADRDWFPAVDELMWCLGLKSAKVGDYHYSTEDLWQFLREMWKISEMDGSPVGEECWEVAGTISNGWGIFEK